jgi:hypothetical protein
MVFFVDSIDAVYAGVLDCLMLEARFVETISAIGGLASTTMRLYAMGMPAPRNAHMSSLCLADGLY